MWENRDFLILVAAGNSGADGSGALAAIEPGSVDSPGTAKNCLTVGASENDRPDQFDTTYGESWPSDFPRNPYRNDSMADSIDDVVAFSSRGPCGTGRRKPDVVAPGTFVLSTRSSQIPFNHFAWGEFVDAPAHYMFMGGTSMATPLVAGAAATVRQFLREFVGYANPPGAMVKAALIHSAQFLNYRFAHPDSLPFADNEQGWGRIELRSIIDPPNGRTVYFVDWPHGMDIGDSVEADITVNDSSIPLRATMAYSDYPGEDLVNSLNLFLVAPDGTFHVGNDFDGAGIPDALNNVEGIVIDNPMQGDWTVRVVASEVQVGPQTFSGVVSGGIQ